MVKAFYWIGYAVLGLGGLVLLVEVVMCANGTLTWQGLPFVASLPVSGLISGLLFIAVAYALDLLEQIASNTHQLLAIVPKQKPLSER